MSLCSRPTETHVITPSQRNISGNSPIGCETQKPSSPTAAQTQPYNTPVVDQRYSIMIDEAHTSGPFKNRRLCLYRITPDRKERHTDPLFLGQGALPPVP